MYFKQKEKSVLKPGGIKEPSEKFNLAEEWGAWCKDGREERATTGLTTGLMTFMDNVETSRIFTQSVLCVWVSE